MSRPRTIRQGPDGSRYRKPVGLLATVLLAGMLAACGSPAPELDRNTATQLQSQVLSVSQAAAANDPAASLKLLDGLLTRLDAAASNGEVSFKRHQSIKSAIDAVRADLTAQQAARAAAEKAAAAKAAAAKAAAAKAAAEKAAAEQAAAAAAIAPAPAPAGNGGPKAKGKHRR
jgi:regulator of protease activity HflC (stomatin/prohibitin superfamily)